VRNIENKKIFLAGHGGMVGKSLFKNLDSRKNSIIVASRKDLDLTNQRHVNEFFQTHQIDEVYIAAARVGGILANSTYPANFIYENLMIQNNLIHAAHQNDINKLLFLGSSCIYPVSSFQPIKENSLLSGPLEETNRAYSVAKIAGIEMCKSYNLQYGRDYRCVMPTNLYGPHDNFNPQNSHVIPSLILKFYEAVNKNFKEVVIWGSGSPVREFMHVDDMSKACIHIMDLTPEYYQNLILRNGSHLNIGTGTEITIKGLSLLLQKITKYEGKITFNREYPDGAPRKLLDSSLLIDSDFKYEYDLEDGLRSTFQWYIKNINNLRS
jgi:GDP-L-fucose synthase